MRIALLLNSFVFYTCKIVGIVIDCIYEFINVCFINHCDIIVISFPCVDECAFMTKNNKQKNILVASSDSGGSNHVFTLIRCIAITDKSNERSFGVNPFCHPSKRHSYHAHQTNCQSECHSIILLLFHWSHTKPNDWNENEIKMNQISRKQRKLPVW